MQIDNSKEYKNCDLTLSSLFYAKHFELLRVDRQGDTCWFVFRDDGDCLEVETNFFARKESVIAKDYADAIRTLKDLVFQKRY